MLGLIRTGGACWDANDPDYAKNWLLSQYQLQADFHPRIQEWLTPAERADIVLPYLLSDDYTVLWALRGGEGSADVLPYLHEKAHLIAHAKPKLLIGLSDFTAVLNYFNQTFQWPVAHGPNIVKIAQGQIDPQSVEAIMALAIDKNASLAALPLTPLNEAAHAQENVQGYCCGGNLSMLAISIKDIWELNAAGKILILEDIGESAHKVSRYLNYFQRIGIFNNIQALLFGAFIFAHDPQKEQYILSTLKRFANACPFPVLHTSAIGHGTHNLPIPFYRKATLSLTENPQLAIGV